MTRDKDMIWRCEDGGNHYVSVSAFNLSGPGSEVYLSIDLQEFAEAGIIGRIRSAWEMLRHGKVLVGEVLLNESIGREVIDQLESVIEQAKLEEAG